MSDWISGYREALKGAITKHGTLGDPWPDYMADVHLYSRNRDAPKWCGGWRAISTPVENLELYAPYDQTYGEYGASEIRAHVTAGATCLCGFIDGVNLVYSGTVSELLQKVLEESE